MRTTALKSVIKKMYEGEWKRTILLPLQRKRHKAMLNDMSLLLEVSKLHNDTFGPYKNYCNGERDVVVCGAGPSLSQYEPIPGAVHIAVNRAFMHEKVDFDFVVAKDLDGIRHCKDELAAYRPDKCVKMLGICALEEKKIPESYILKCKAKKFYTDGVFLNNTGNFKYNLNVDIDSRPLANMDNIGQAVMQIALFMNPRKIYIVGCDLSGSHFTAEGLSEAEAKKEEKKLNKLWAKSLKKQIKSWNAIKHFAQVYYTDVEIVSVNPVGLKGLFKDVYTNGKEG